MTIWLPDRSTLTSPLHVSLAARYTEAMAEGLLAAGTRLPTHRALARELDLSVQTVSKAYEILQRDGLIDSHVGRGTVVLDRTAASRQPFRMERDNAEVTDLSISRPVYDAIHVVRMHEALNELTRDLDHDTYLACRPNVGLDSHRRAGVDWLARCGLETQVEAITITNGVCQGLSVVLLSLVRPGDVVVTEDVAHHLIVSMCGYLGIRLVGLPTDDEGIIPAAFREACQTYPVRALFIVPSLAGPLVHAVPESRRQDLVAVARQHDVLIIEDDAWGPVAQDRAAPLAGLAPERSVYLTSFTKCTMSGLRTGYMVAPEKLRPALTGRQIALNWMATPLIAEIAARWVRDGTAEDLCDWQRVELARRYAVVREEMAAHRWRGHPASLHFWLDLPEGWTPDAAVAQAAARGVAVAPAQPFLTAQAAPRNAIRVAIGGAHDLPRFRNALRLLDDMLASPPERMAFSL